jgi:hypothetical protein
MTKKSQKKKTRWAFLVFKVGQQQQSFFIFYFFCQFHQLCELMREYED